MKDDDDDAGDGFERAAGIQTRNFHMSILLLLPRLLKAINRNQKIYPACYSMSVATLHFQLPLAPVETKLSLRLLSVS